MNTRLKIICILFSITYLFMIGDTLYQTIYIDVTNIDIDNEGAYQAGNSLGKKIATGEIASPWLEVFLPVVGISIISLSCLFLLIYIPIKTYRVIRSVIKNDLFDLKNIKRIRMVGYALLLLFSLALALYPLIQHVYTNILSIPLKENIGSIRDDYPYLIIGLLVLLFAEVMKISHTIKEENDLTV